MGEHTMISQKSLKFCCHAALTTWVLLAFVAHPVLGKIDESLKLKMDNELKDFGLSGCSEAFWKTVEEHIAKAGGRETDKNIADAVLIMYLDALQERLRENELLKRLQGFRATKLVRSSTEPRSGAEA